MDTSLGLPQTLRLQCALRPATKEALQWWWLPLNLNGAATWQRSTASAPCRPPWSRPACSPATAAGGPGSHTSTCGLCTRTGAIRRHLLGAERWRCRVPRRLPTTRKRGRRQGQNDKMAQAGAATQLFSFRLLRCRVGQPSTQQARGCGGTTQAGAWRKRRRTLRRTARSGARFFFCVAARASFPRARGGAPTPTPAAL